MTTLVERMLEKFSPPLDTSLIISLSEGLPDTDQGEKDLIETLSSLVEGAAPQPPRTNSPAGDQPLLHQVRNLFPHLSESLIQRAISNNSSDLNEIIDYLQAVEYEDHEPTSPDQDHDPPIPPTKTPKRKVKKSKKPQTYHLNDVLQRETGVRSKQFQEAQAPHQINNVWVTGDSQITHLSKLLGIASGKIYSTFHSKACNLVLTLEEIFARLEPSKRSDIINDPDRLDQLTIQRSFLKTMLSNNDDESLTRLLILTDLDPGNAYDLWLFLEDVQDRYGTLPLNQFFFSNSDSARADSSSDLVVHKSSQSSSIQHFPTCSKTVENTEKWTPVRQTTKGTQSGERSVEHCLNQLKELERKYEETRQMLKNPHVVVGQTSNNHSRVYIDKRAVQGSIAMIRRENADQFLAQVKQLELECTRSIIAQRQRDRNDSNSIDLHGLTTNQAAFITSQYLLSWWNNVKHLANAYNSPYEPFRIITGAGTHSINSRPRLLLTITRLLDDERWKWKYEDCNNGLVGSLIVHGVKKH